MKLFALATAIAALCAVLAATLVPSDPLLDETLLDPLSGEHGDALSDPYAPEPMFVTDTDAHTQREHGDARGAKTRRRAAPGVIEGAVVDASGLAVPFASVRAGDAELEADRQGHFTLASEGPRRLMASDAERRSPPVLARPGGLPVRLVLSPTATLEVSVQRPDGGPALLGAVQVASMLGSERRTVERFDGMVRFEGLLAGLVTVVATNDPFGARARAVRLVPGVTQKLTLRLTPAAALLGTVHDAGNGKPISGAQLEVSGPSFDAVQITSLDDGSFRAPGIPVDELVTVRVLKTGYAGLRLETEVGREAKPLRLALGVAADLQGRVVDGHGRPVLGARVALHGAGNAPLVETTSAADGRFTLPRPASDESLVDVVASRGVAWGSVDARAASIDGLLPRLTLLDAAAVGGTLEGVAPGTRLRLVPQPMTTAPVGPLRASALVAGYTAVGRSHLEVRTEASGAFRFDPVPAGAYQLEVSTPSGAWTSPEDVVVLGADRALDPIEIDGLRVAGVVWNFDGRPLPGVRIAVQEDFDTAPARFATTDADGRFVLVGLPAGRYRVGASLPGYGPRRTVVNLPVKADVELQLGALAALAGRVTAPGGAVSGPATVRVYDLLDGGEHAREYRVFIAAGAFRIDGLRAGEYRVELVTDDGRTAEDGLVELTPAQAGEGRLDLLARAP